MRVKAGSYGNQSFTARTLTAPSIEFRSDGGTVTFGVVNMQGADYLRFYGSWRGSTVRANSCGSGPSSCQQSRSIAWSGLTLNPGFANTKAVDLMGNAIGWTFRNINICCTHNDKLVNIDNFYNQGQTTDIVFEHGSVHSQTVDVNGGSGADVHTECFWNLGPQSLVIRAIHVYGCNGTIGMNLDDNGDALVPANLMLENNVFEPPMNDDGQYTGVAGQTSTDDGYRGVNYIRNNIFQQGYALQGSTTRTITIANNIGPGLGCGKPGVTYIANRWTNQDCSTSDVQDGSALASSRYTDAPRTDAEASNTQAGSQVHGDFRSVSGAAQIDAGSTTFAHDFDFAPRSASPDQGPFEFAASAPSNEPPTANFITPTAGATANFDAESSIDPDGTITEYRWDWNNDGTVDTTASSPSITRSVAVGNVIRLTVVDNAGSVSAAKIVQLL